MEVYVGLDVALKRSDTLKNLPPLGVTCFPDCGGRRATVWRVSLGSSILRIGTRN